jgi:glycosyltransferase involved in cell wall biosynthesis
MTSVKDSVTLVIPVYNEQECIQTVLSSWQKQLTEDDIDHDFLLINDGSTDQTLEILKDLEKKWSNLRVIHQKNQGHGAAVKNGYISSLEHQSNYIFQTDSDNQFSPEDFRLLWCRRKESLAVFGIRKARKDPFSRKMISLTLRSIISKFFGISIPDANIPYRLFEKRFFQSLIQALPTGVFAPNVFLSILAFKYLKKPITIPVQHFSRDGTEAKLIRLGLIKACFQTFFDVLNFSYNINKKIAFINEKYLLDQASAQERKQLETKVRPASAYAA